MGLLIFTNYKDGIYDSILVIIDWLTRMVYFELLKMTINVLYLATVILDMTIQYHNLSN